MQYLINEYGKKYLEDVGLDLIVRKHVYNCSRIFTHSTCGCENMYIVRYSYMGESTEPVFVIVYGAQESILRNRFRQPM
jgi:hypothetical protein